jgi:predicted small lipoprotein YifL
MFATRAVLAQILVRRSWRPLALAACTLLALAGCGQRGPLYLPDRDARVATRPASSAPAVSSGASSASSAPR